VLQSRHEKTRFLKKIGAGSLAASIPLGPKDLLLWEDNKNAPLGQEKEKAGESFSYLRAFRARSKIRVAAVGVGYSDGYPFLFRGKVRALIGKKIFAGLEAVTSNHLMVDLGNEPDIRIGDEVRLIDQDNASGMTADALAKQSGNCLSGTLGNKKLRRPSTWRGNRSGLRIKFLSFIRPSR